MARKVYTIHAELADFDQPKTWRDFKITHTVTLQTLGYFLEIMFEMKDAHLFSFRETTDTWTRVWELDPDSPEGFSRKGHRLTYHDTRGSKVMDLKLHEQLSFYYDSGDSWQVNLTVTDIDESGQEDGNNLPRVIDGAGFGILEDFGGVDRLGEIASLVKRDGVTAHRSELNWSGQWVPDNFTFDFYDQDDLNFRLKRLVQAYRQVYENHLNFGAKMAAILDREYYPGAHQKEEEPAPSVEVDLPLVVQQLKKADGSNITDGKLARINNQLIAAFIEDLKKNGKLSEKTVKRYHDELTFYLIGYLTPRKATLFGWIATDIGELYFKGCSDDEIKRLRAALNKLNKFLVTQGVVTPQWAREFKQGLKNSIEVGHDYAKETFSDNDDGLW